MSLAPACPACLEDRIGGPFSLQREITCAGCGARLTFPASGGPLHTVPEFVTPAHRHLARRVDPPPKTRLRFQRTGDSIQAQSMNWLVRLFEKKVVLGRDGFTTRARNGFSVPLPEIVGFFAVPYFTPPNTYVDFVSVAVFQVGGEQKFNEIFLHKRPDAEYLASTFNQHLAELRAGVEPYRG